MLKICVVTIAVLMLNTTPVSAQTAEHTQSTEHAHSTHHHKNHLAVFLGATSFFEKNGTHFSLGVDYLRTVSVKNRISVGGFGEVIFAEHEEWLFGLMLTWKFYDQFWIRGGPGIEFVQEEEHSDEAQATASDTHTNTKTVVEALTRVGFGYTFHVKEISVAPSLDLDFVRSSTSIVWGLNFGYGF